MSRDEAFLAFYIECRFQDQRNYYRTRRDQFRAALRETSLFSGVFMALASGASVAGALNWPYKPWWAALATMLPAIAGLGLALQRLYAYEQLLKLYEDAIDRLDDARWTPTKTATSADQIRAYAGKVEDVFTKERSQWGQITEKERLTEPKAIQAHSADGE